MLKILPLILVILLPFNASAEEEMHFWIAGWPANWADAEWIAAEGKITEDTPAKLKLFLDEHEGQHTNQLFFHSPGGNLNSALKIGRMLRERKIRVRIGNTQSSDTQTSSTGYGTKLLPGTCESACAFAFLGGVDRNVLNFNSRHVKGPSKFGVHRFYRSSGAIRSESAQLIMGALVIYLIDMGIDPRLLTLASQTPSEEMYFLNQDELSSLNVHKAPSETDGQLELFRDGLAWTSKVLDNLGKQTEETRLYCKGPNWFIFNTGGANAQSKYHPYFRYKVFGETANLHDSTITIEGRTYKVPAQTGSAVNDRYELDLNLGPRFHEFANREIEHFSFVESGNWSPKIFRKLPKTEEFKILARTCASY